jgi:predicted dehydrogenase
MRKKKYVQVGLGGRHELFRDALLGPFSSWCELVALCDINRGRLDLSRQRALNQFNKAIDTYPADQFDDMVLNHRPDCVIVTSIDSTHDDYICRALEQGCHVITEKPLTVDSERCHKILKTQRRTGKTVKVAFNYRYSPVRTQIKQLLEQDIIGRVLSIDFHWMLDTIHGADYFRRWHRQKKNSGGLLVHKATHHFDLINWWIDSLPESVYAGGRKRFYTPAMADELRLTSRADRCMTCPEASVCAFFLDLKQNSNLNAMYAECEHYDGYYRDGCVFDNLVDIEDCMNVIVNYRNGVKMSYSLNAFVPWEGYMIAFNGTKGRLEHKLRETVYINADGKIPAETEKDGSWIWFYPHSGKESEIPVRESTGGHGGGDDLMLNHLFNPHAEKDPLGRAADHIAGAWSILTGIAANRSIRERRVIQIEELTEGLLK